MISAFLYFRESTNGISYIFMHKIFKIPIDVTTSILFTTKDTNAKQSLVEYISSSKRQDFKTSKKPV